MQNPLLPALFVVLMYVFLAVSCFLFAGTWNLPIFWLVIATQLIAGLLALKWVDPDLISERIHPRGKDRDPSAKFILTILFLANFWIAALDVGHWHFSHISNALKAVAFIFQAIGWIGLYWAMLTNRFFTMAIRLQPDRQQRVVAEGPYKYVRHPGYAFSALAFLFQGIALGSWFAEIPALLILIHMVYRTFLEEKMLAEGLPGYSEYKQKVPYRWLPGVW